MDAKVSFSLTFGHRPGRRTFRAVCLLFLLSATPIFAQTVQPLIDENVVKGPGKTASGKIEYINDSTQTLSVVLEARSFTVSDTGELSYRPLDEGIHAKFSTMSFRIPPKQNFFVFYEASADKLPSWFVVYATFGGFKERTPEGFRIQIQLPHTIYVLPKQELRKDELVVKVVEYRAGEKKIILPVENLRSLFGRAFETHLSMIKNYTYASDFPIFSLQQPQAEISLT